jgi:hypothetical protein
VDFLVALRIIARRWYLVIFVLLLTAGAAHAVGQAIAPTYRVTGGAMLVSPLPPPDPVAGLNPLNQNPYVRYDFSIGVLTAVTTQIMDDIVVRDVVADRGGRPDYRIDAAGNNVPLVYVTAEDVDEQLAVGTVALVLATMNEELDRRQAEAGAPEGSRVRPIVISLPTKGTELTGSRIRAMLAVSVLGTGGALSLAFLAESRAQSRRRRRQPVEPDRGRPYPLDIRVDARAAHNESFSTTAAGAGRTPGRR